MFDVGAMLEAGSALNEACTWLFEGKSDLNEQLFSACRASAKLISGMAAETNGACNTAQRRLDLIGTGRKTHRTEVIH